MDKKWISKTLLVTVVLILSACSAEKSTSLLEVTKMDDEKKQNVSKQIANDQGYELITETYSKENVKLEYPQIINFNDERKRQEINELIKKEALTPFQETIQNLEQDQKYKAEGKYEIKLKNNQILSIAYNSYNNISPSAHPYNLFFTTNIDLTTGKQLFLSDFVSKIDKDFIRLLKNAKYVGDLGDDFDPQIKELAFGQYSSDEDLILALTNNKENGIYVYVIENALGISMPVAHVAGDHAEFEINLNLLNKK
ncbi:PdaC/SigV domain-containing protein [Ureibacillus manganicus]|uniref:Uncharacterized protein n=1 Tax=Ureibacillus manganicus DSM 26584 TaxID=1384049 RepID=A0A0A3I2X6_9BACL|nr:DUF4163 domain-containing protein [Ureibacillus manganicus]KGR79176.1 hypothetical protein CD29_07445 [Ureibacillus manganicus DSM 26584]